MNNLGKKIFSCLSNTWFIHSKLAPCKQGILYCPVHCSETFVSLTVAEANTQRCWGCNPEETKLLSLRRASSQPCPDWTWLEQCHCSGFLQPLRAPWGGWEVGEAGLGCRVKMNALCRNLGPWFYKFLINLKYCSILEIQSELFKSSFLTLHRFLWGLLVRHIFHISRRKTYLFAHSLPSHFHLNGWACFYFYFLFNCHSSAVQTEPWLSQPIKTWRCCLGLGQRFNI